MAASGECQRRRTGLARKVAAVDPVLQPEHGLAERRECDGQKAGEVAPVKATETLGDVHPHAGSRSPQLVAKVEVRCCTGIVAEQAIDLELELPRQLPRDQIFYAVCSHTHEQRQPPCHRLRS